MTLVDDLDRRVAHALLEATRDRLARDSLLVLLGHGALIVLVAILVRGEVRPSGTNAWIVSLLLATILRAGWMWRAPRSDLDDAAVVRGARVTAALHALAWGLGAALVMPSLTTSDLAIVLLVLAGIGAGSLATLAADAPSLYAFLAALSLPLPFGVVAAGMDRDHLVAAGIVLVFSPVMLTLYRRAHAVLVDSTRTTIALKDSLARNRLLGALLPICANCKKIRDDQGYWNNVERYVSEHSDVQFSHGVCPECLPKLFPGVVVPDAPAEA